MDEVYNSKNKEWHKKSNGKPGESNCQSLYKDNEIFIIRKYYTTHTLKETYTKFNKSNSLDSFRRSLIYQYLNIPVYHKNKKY